MALPSFKYHPDPIATGSVVPADSRCSCCGQARGYLYTGPIYTAQAERSDICPWCIADGTASTRLDATFTDEQAVGGYGRWPAVPPATVDEVARRTPGFSGWQQEQWWTHCGDAAAYLGPAGAAELRRLGVEALEAIRLDADLPEGPEWLAFLASLAVDGSPTAYVFRCTRCGGVGGYWDCH